MSESKTPANSERSTPWVSAVPAVPAVGVYFRAFDSARFPLGGNQELVYSPLTRVARTLPVPAVRFLQGCRGFATLDQHAVQLCRQLNTPPEQLPQLRAQLAQLAEAGLLVSAEQLRRTAVDRTPPEDAPPALATVAIPTRNRTPALERCLVSALEACRRQGRTPNFLIVDDSDRPEDRQANRQLLESLRARHEAAVAYAGSDEKRQLVEALCAQGGFEPDVVRFGLLNESRHPVGTGANRNVALLATVGDRVLQMDDDTVWRVAPVPGSRPGLRLSSQADPTDFWFFADGEPPNPPGGFQDVDVIGLHEGLLGKRLGHCLAAANPVNGLDLDGAETGFVQNLLAGTAQVRLTTTGVVGHSGMGSPLYLLCLDGEARTRLLRSERDYRRALTQQEMLRGVSQATICDGAFCMALHLGLDNRQLLPPFLPVYRNQDGVFATILRVCFPGACQGFLPWVVQHLPPTSRPLTAFDPAAGAGKVRTGQLIQALIGSFQPGPGGRTAPAALRALGRTLVELAALDREEFVEVVRLQLWNHAHRLTTRLQTLLGKYGGEPRFWAADVQRVLAAVREAVPAPNYGLPVDLEPATPDGAGWTALRDLVRRFAELIALWPDLVEAARQLRRSAVVSWIS